MKKSKLYLAFIISCFILLAGSIWFVKTNPSIKKKVKVMLGMKKPVKERIVIYDHSNQIALEKPAVLSTMPEFNLTDQENTPFSSEEMKGKIWLVNFIFSRCPTTCPIQTANMATIQAQLARYALWNDVSFISITVDPEYDQPNVLKEYAAANNASLENWKFLTGERDYIWKLSKEGFALNVGEDKPSSETPLFHSPNFILIDREANIRGYYNSTQETELDSLLEDVRALIVEKKGKLAIPESIITPLWLDDRKEEQLKTIPELEVYHDFKFTDQLEQSGINFRHQVTAVGGLNFETNHYDHGNGLAVADIDGDGWEDIYFISQIGTNQLWRNLGNGKFEDITAKAGVGMLKELSVSASFADTDNDGDADLYVTTVRDGNRLFENTGNGTFKDISKTSGLNHKGHSSGSVFFDYNNDGLLDLFVTNVGQYTLDSIVTMEVNHPTNSLQNGSHTYYAGIKDAFAGHLKPERAEKSLLFRNKGNNQFEDVTSVSKLEHLAWSGDATPLDLNEDGWLDLYVVAMQGDDEYYENKEGKFFEKRSREYFPKTSWGAMGVKSFDYNNDGNLDIYVTDMHSDMAGNQTKGTQLIAEKEKSLFVGGSYEYLRTNDALYGNALFENAGDGSFVEVSAEKNAENYWPWGLSVGDLNADGYDDAFLTSSMNYSFRYAINSLLLNNKGKKFMDSEFILGVEPRKDGISATHWFNLDCVDKDKKHYLCDERKGEYEVFGALGSRSSAIFDVDHDGDLDIITSEYNSEPMILISNLSEQNKTLSFLKIKLIGTTSNKDGLGAKVIVKTASTNQTKVNDGKSGYLSQSSFPLYFGLGEDQEVQQIEVIWPSGKKQLISKNIKLNDLLILEEK